MMWARKTKHCNTGLKSIMAITTLVIATSINVTQAELALNFLPANANIVVTSIANQNCNAVAGGGMGGGMMGGMGGMMMGTTVGPGCSRDYFLQEVINDNGNQYYHVILGNPTQDNFALEYYMRTGGCCWRTGGGMMGGMMGGGMMGSGDAPLSSSYGNINDPLFNALTPLSNNSSAGNASGNPSRVYMRQINNDATMTQDFTKAKELNKPHITQTVKSGTAMTATFDLDMSNGNYNSYSNPVKFTNITTVAGIGSYDTATSNQAKISAGRFTYSPGTSFNGSLGNYKYERDSINAYNINWLSYCQPSQNPDHQCIFNNNAGGGGMMGGGMGM